MLRLMLCALLVAAGLHAAESDSIAGNSAFEKVMGTWKLKTENVPADQTAARDATLVLAPDHAEFTTADKKVTTPLNADLGVYPSPGSVNFKAEAAPEDSSTWTFSILPDGTMRRRITRAAAEHGFHAEEIFELISADEASRAKAKAQVLSLEASRKNKATALPLAVTVMRELTSRTRLHEREVLKIMQDTKSTDDKSIDDSTRKFALFTKSLRETLERLKKESGLTTEEIEGASAIQQPPAVAKTESFKPLGFEMAFPPEWKPANRPPRCVIAFRRFSPDERTTVLVTLSVTDQKKQPQTLAEFVEKSLKGIDAGLKDYKLVEKAETKLSGEDAIKVTYTFDAGPFGTERNVGYYVVWRKRSYLLRTFGVIGDYDTFAKEIDAIVASFKLVEPK